MKPYIRKITKRIQSKSFFYNIMFTFLFGSAFLLISFSLLLTSFLTQKTIDDLNKSAQYSIDQAYITINNTLSTCYKNFAGLKRELAINQALFSDHLSSLEEYQVSLLLENMTDANKCVDSAYIINRNANKVYTSQGYISDIDSFYDKDAISLWKRYNPMSPDAFIPRTTNYTRLGTVYTYHYITLVYTQKNNQNENDGALIVNISQEKLLDQLALEPQLKDGIYIITQSGTIVWNKDIGSNGRSIEESEASKAIISENKDITMKGIFQGQECIINSRRAPSLRFIFVSAVPLSGIHAQVSYIRNTALLLILATLIVTLLFSILFSRKIYSPIAGMIRGLQKDNIPDPHKSQLPQSDLDYLGSTLNHLKQQIKSLDYDVKKLSVVNSREILFHLVSGDYDSEDICRDKLSSCGIVFDKPLFVALIISFDDYNDIVKKTLREDISTYHYSILNIAQELLSERYDVITSEAPFNYVFLILNCQEPAQEQWIRLTLQKINDVMMEYVKRSASFGIGTYVQSLMDINKSFIKAFSALSYRMVKGASSIIFYEEIAAKEHMVYDYPSEEEKSSVIAIRGRNTENMKRAVDRFMEKIAETSIDNINMAVSQLLITWNQILKTIHQDDLSPVTYQQTLQQVNNCSNLEEVKEILYSYALVLIQLKNSELHNKNVILMKQAVQYMNENFSNPDLSIEMIAESIGLSPSYTSTLFKEMNQISPGEYITNIRLKKAKELLETTDKSGKEIAALIGYDYRYFYTVFKSRIGMTVKEYRKMSGNEEMT
ncbi:AraC family transcriptional regulator [Lacrimispora sinapis]|uniref:AraC family transcriptional regulator n=1 Tax=Lacrimispora sinapis TaxID=3111456 RepID=UPI003747AF3C